MSRLLFTAWFVLLLDRLHKRRDRYLVKNITFSFKLNAMESKLSVSLTFLDCLLEPFGLLLKNFNAVDLHLKQGRLDPAE